MTTIPTNHPTQHLETARTLDAVSQTVAAVLRGEFTLTPGPTARPIPIVFLDDGRRVFLVLDNPVSSQQPADRPRSWGLEITRDSDLSDGSAGERTATRTTQRLTQDAALEAARYLLSTTA